MFLVGKRPGPVLMAASTAGLPCSRLFFVTDHASGLRFLVDTGAEVSVIPPSRGAHSSTPAGPSLQAANKSVIATFSTRSLVLNLRLRRSFPWTFIITVVQHPILGADFLSHFNLLVDVTHSHLEDNVMQLQVNGISTPALSPSPTVSRPPNRDMFSTILDEFPTLVRPPPPNQPVQHSITHHISTTGPPVAMRPVGYHLSVYR